MPETLPTKPNLEALAERVEGAIESWRRVLNMAGGRAQETAAALWATIHADKFEEVAAHLRALATQEKV